VRRRRDRAVTGQRRRPRGGPPVHRIQAYGLRVEPVIAGLVRLLAFAYDAAAPLSAIVVLQRAVNAVALVNGPFLDDGPLGQSLSFDGSGALRPGRPHERLNPSLADSSRAGGRRPRPPPGLTRAFLSQSVVRDPSVTILLCTSSVGGRALLRDSIANATTASTSVERCPSPDGCRMVNDNQWQQIAYVGGGALRVVGAALYFDRRLA